MTAKKTKQRTVEGTAPPKETPQGQDGLLLAFECRDIIRHDKDGKASVPLFANLGPRGEPRLGTVVVNINGLTADGIAYLERAMGLPSGAHLAAKTDISPGTPIMGTLLVAEKSLLDYWTKEHPTKEDIKKADAEAKKQKTLDTGADA